MNHQEYLIFHDFTGPELQKEMNNRVSRGATDLDRQRPNWYNDIDLTTLDVGSTKHCIVSQLYHGRDANGFDFSYGLNDLGWESWAYGVGGMCDGDTIACAQHAWVREIAYRRVHAHLLTEQKEAFCGAS